MSIDLLFWLLSLEEELPRSYISELIVNSTINPEDKSELIFLLYKELIDFKRTCATLIGMMA